MLSAVAAGLGSIRREKTEELEIAVNIGYSHG
jgi:hypothetical protein